ncbi:hypothetical protein [Paenibacillus sp. 481]|uniref:hypothetical protein n=1 Tax=Paenibacillus sp. 481 TaxID=2835869 RepID=UPI001E4F6136|nr:hypothetical protein [Paenibacillus sp. 481]UHA73164.1 hypothetical protein KIK04_21650 [Paenibacillus sp. 481]
MGYQVRVVAGSVSANGSVVSGKGFRVSKVGTGLYDVFFTPPFGSPPGVSATQVFFLGGLGGDTRDNAVLVFIQNDRFRVKTGASDGTAQDRDFSFVAAGC